MARTTELEAVNEILMSAGIAEVSDLGASTLADVEEADQAYKVLQRISREVQSGGLHCNSESDITWSPVGNEITVAANVLRVDKHYPSDPDVAVRGAANEAFRLYNLTDSTFTFTDDIQVDVIYQLDYEYLPEHVRRYIQARAARTFVLRYLRDTELWQALKEDELHARQAFNTGEIENSDTNMLHGYPSNEMLVRSPRSSTLLY